MMIGRSRSLTASIVASSVRLAVRLLLDRELDDQDRVLRRQADDRDQPDVEVDVGREPAQHREQHRAEHAERHDQQHRDRHRPALVERGEQQEHDHQRQAEQRDRSGRPTAVPRRRCRSIRSRSPAGSSRASRSISAIASPVDWPGAAHRPRWSSTDSRCSAGAAAAPRVHSTVVNAPNGTISPCRVAHLEVEHVLRRHADRARRRQQHAQDAAFAAEVVGVGAAESDRERGVDVGDRQAERARLDRGRSATRSCGASSCPSGRTPTSSGLCVAAPSSWLRAASSAVVAVWPPRSCSMKVKPLATPSPWIAGGLSVNTIASLICRSAPIALLTSVVGAVLLARALVPRLQRARRRSRSPGPGRRS